MFRRRKEPPPFASAIRGYNRAQVEAHLAGLLRWSTQAWNRIQELEARVSELEELCEEARRDREGADVLVEQAEAHKADAERAAAEMEEAQAQRERLEKHRAELLDELTNVRQSLEGILQSPATDGPDGDREHAPPGSVSPEPAWQVADENFASGS